MNKKVQVTIIQIDNYGPWTTTLGYDREYHIQMLQASLYSELQKEFSEKGGLVFYNRFDEMIAITNGIGQEGHKKIQDNIAKQFPVSISMSTGIGDTPYQAQMTASKALQQTGSAQSSSRKEILVGEYLEDGLDYVQVAHLDIDGITRRATDVKSSYDTSRVILNIFSSLGDAFVKRGSLLFYLGGDNFMAISNGIESDFVKSVLDEVRSTYGLGMKGGIGKSRTARRAAELATQCLDEIREKRVTGPVFSLSDLT
ncbi:MAG: GTP cyclohydrolase IIa [Thaumarchaeota archaeon]|nr:GTP cyclohydrolase IIa [Nitrososphaerota archaeon]